MSNRIAQQLHALQLAEESRRVNAQLEPIEWEELPSLAAALRRAGETPATAWGATMPACLEPVFEPDPFREPIEGLATREVREPDVFRHFFV